jgi:hypothetical protein
MVVLNRRGMDLSSVIQRCDHYCDAEQGYPKSIFFAFEPSIVYSLSRGRHGDHSRTFWPTDRVVPLDILRGRDDRFIQASLEERSLSARLVLQSTSS